MLARFFLLLLFHYRNAVFLIFLSNFIYDFVSVSLFFYVHFWGSSRVVHNPYHAPYAPYNPVSRQDSEISSDAHTDDTRSLTDSSV